MNNQVTRRTLLMGASTFVLAGGRGQAQVIILPPIVQVSTSHPAVKAAGGASVGKVIVIGAMAYIIRGMIGAMVIAFIHKRQATLWEFLLWPLPTPKPGPAEEKYLRLALTLSNTPGWQKQVSFWIAEGKFVQWPTTAAEMKKAIAFYRRWG